MNEAPLYLRIADLLVEIDGWDDGLQAFRKFSVDPSALDAEPVPDLRVKYVPSVTEEPWLRLHRLLSEALIEKDVLLFHASAVALDGEGYAFTAPSGTGKSTHVALWKLYYGERLVFVNDDKPFLVFRDEEVFIAGSPWMGKHRRGENVTVPLRGIAFLNRDKENRLTGLSPVDGYMELMKQVFLPPTKEGMEKVLALLERVVTKVPCYRLACTPDQAAVEAASEMLRREGQ